MEPCLNDNFQRWFGDSRVVTEDGRPQPVFHGTPGPLFDAFDGTREGTTTFIGIPVKVRRHGFFFAEDYAFAESFARQGESRQGSVMAVYLDIQRPLRMLEGGVHWKDVDRLVAQGVDRHWLENVAGGVRDTWEQFDDEDGAFLAAAIRAAGYDGVLTNELCPETDEAKLAWIAFEPTQVKSVLNPGTWDPWNPRLRDAGTMAALPRGHALQFAGADPVLAGSSGPR